MKKGLILACLAASALSSIALDANATAVCTGGTGTSISVSSGSNFIKQPFTARCSANVFSNYTENGTAMGVSSGSAKGKNVYNGGTAGGGVKQYTTCATTGCTASEVSDTASNAALNAS